MLVYVYSSILQFQLIARSLANTITSFQFPSLHPASPSCALPSFTRYFGRIPAPHTLTRRGEPVLVCALRRRGGLLHWWATTPVSTPPSTRPRPDSHVHRMRTTAPPQKAMHAVCSHSWRKRQKSVQYTATTTKSAQRRMLHRIAHCFWSHWQFGSRRFKRFSIERGGHGEQVRSVPSKLARALRSAWQSRRA